MKKNEKHLYYGGLTLLFLLYSLFHLYKLDSLPFSMHVDEMGLWYNVKCLLNYGTDQANNSWPLLFANMWGEQSAAYTYLAYITSSIFGLSLFAIRLPAALCSILTFIFGYKIVDKLYKNNKINLLFCVFLTTFPYFIMEARIALDCHLMLSFSTVFLYLFLKAIDTGKISDAIYAGISCGLVLYTYALSYIAMPIFLIFAVVYLLITKKVTWKQVVAFATPIIVLATPLILIQAINILDLNEIKIGQITLPKFNHSRETEFGIKNFVSQATTPLITIFASGSRLYECVITYSNIYWVFVPFFLIGFGKNIYLLFKRMEFERLVLFVWWICVYLTTCLIQSDLASWHLNGLMLVSVIFIIDGLIAFSKLFKEKNTKILMLSLVCIVYLCSAVSFINYYYLGSYNTDEAKTFYVYDKIDDLQLDKNHDIYILGPSLLYRIQEDVSPVEYPLSYTGSKENMIKLGDYYFDDGGTSLNNINENAVYVVPIHHIVYIQTLDKSGLNKTQIGGYYIYT